MTWINGGSRTAWTEPRGWSTRPLGEFEAPEPPGEALMFWDNDEEMLWDTDVPMLWADL